MYHHVPLCPPPGVLGYNNLKIKVVSICINCLDNTIFPIASYESAHNLWQVVYFHQRFSRVIFSHHAVMLLNTLNNNDSICGDQERDYDDKILASIQLQSSTFH